MSKYNKQYFIDKFSAIPSDQWIENFYSDKSGKYHCVLGHLGAGIKNPLPRNDEEYACFNNLIWDNLKCNPIFINDGFDARYKQDNPKDRILAALNDIKDIKD